MQESRAVRKDELALNLDHSWQNQLPCHSGGHGTLHYGALLTSHRNVTILTHAQGLMSLPGTGLSGYDRAAGMVPRDQDGVPDMMYTDSANSAEALDIFSSEPPKIFLCKPAPWAVCLWLRFLFVSSLIFLLELSLILPPFLKNPPLRGG